MKYSLPLLVVSRLMSTFLCQGSIFNSRQHSCCFTTRHLLKTSRRKLLGRKHITEYLFYVGLRRAESQELPVPLETIRLLDACHLRN